MRLNLLEVAWFLPVSIVYLTLIRTMYHGDAYLYWQSGHLGYPSLPVEGFVYPPPALLLFWPVQFLPYEVFYAGWLVLLMATMRWLLGPWLMLVFIVPNVLGWHALASGNVAMLIGAGIAYGIEHPAGWLVPALTKVTPAIGLGWLLLRREWRTLGMTLGLIALACLASFLIAPWLWPQWIHVMVMNSGSSTNAAFSITTVPASWRLALSALIVALAAWRNAPWAVPVAGMYALGWIGDTTSLVALGSVRLIRTPASPC